MCVVTGSANDMIGSGYQIVAPLSSAVTLAARSMHRERFGATHPGKNDTCMMTSRPRRRQGRGWTDN